MKSYIAFIILLILALSCSDEETIKPAVWKKMDSHTTFTLTDVEFINNDFGIICGSSGTLLKTNNGGKDWIPINFGISSTFMKAFILNENEFYTSRVGLYKTSNGGRGFSELGKLSDYFGTIFGIHFFDSNNGLIYKNGLILKTNDGGKNWNTVYTQAGYALLMQFVSNNIGFIAGGISYDGGSYGELHKTINGGNSWTEVEIPSEIKKSEISAIYFISEDTGYITNYNKELYITQDGGTTWNLILDYLPEKLRDMVFLTQNEGYGIGYRSVYKTIDGGITWLKDYEDSTLVLASITKTPDEKIFVVGKYGIILKKE